VERHLLFVMFVMSITSCTSNPCDVHQLYKDPTAAPGEPRYIDENGSACAQTLPSLDSGGIASTAVDPDGGTYALYDDDMNNPVNLVAFDAADHVRWQVGVSFSNVPLFPALFATHDGVYLYSCYEPVGGCGVNSVDGYAAQDGSTLTTGVPATFSGFTATSDALYFTTATGSSAQIAQVESGAVTWTQTLTTTDPNGVGTQLITTLADGGVAVAGSLNGTLDIAGTTATATQGMWYAEWGATGALSTVSSRGTDHCGSTSSSTTSPRSLSALPRSSSERTRGLTRQVARTS
jgi:hypothetical protein